MDVLKSFIVTIFILSAFISCTKTSYILEQGIGQISLEYNGRSNIKVLMDPEVSDKHKEKIRLVEKAKDYFFHYFSLESTDIYDETTFLDSEAVTYLLIASPKDRIKAKKFSFPVVGTFPYIGFFKKESAINYAETLREEGLEIYLRPVYAYSTLNQWIFDDNILSSFFYFSDEQLVTLIFHELIHTIFFLKGEVEFNENLAEFISQNMVEDFFQYSEKTKEQVLTRKRQNSQLNSFIADKAKELDRKYQKGFADGLKDRFLEDDFIPGVKLQCQKLEIKNCYPLKGKWNNARFAAFMTYEAKQNQFGKIYKKSKLSLKDFFLKIIQLEKKYDKSNNHKESEKFIRFLERKM